MQNLRRRLRDTHTHTNNTTHTHKQQRYELVSGTDFGCALHVCAAFLAKLIPNAWPQPYARIGQPATKMTNMLAQSATKARGSSIAPSHRPKRSGWRRTLARQWLCAEAGRSDQDANKAHSRKTSWQCFPCTGNVFPAHLTRCFAKVFPALAMFSLHWQCFPCTGNVFPATLQPRRPSQCGRDAFASGQGRQHPHCASKALRHCGAHGLPKSLRCRTALLGRASGAPKDMRPHE